MVALQSVAFTQRTGAYDAMAILFVGILPVPYPRDEYLNIKAINSTMRFYTGYENFIHKYCYRHGISNKAFYLEMK